MENRSESHLERHSDFDSENVSVHRSACPWERMREYSSEPLMEKMSDFQMEWLMERQSVSPWVIHSEAAWALCSVPPLVTPMVLRSANDSEKQWDSVSVNESVSSLVNRWGIPLEVETVHCSVTSRERDLETPLGPYSERPSVPQSDPWWALRSDFESVPWSELQTVRSMDSMSEELEHQRVLKTVQHSEMQMGSVSVRQWVT